MINTTITAKNNPRNITHIVVHCSATPQNTTIDSIQRFWRSPRPDAPNGWKSPGYHYIIEASGNIVSLLPETMTSNGVAGHNSTCVHICYIGGVDKNNKPMDTRTDEQKAALQSSLELLKRKYPSAIIQGHRDFPNVKKACPSFDAKTAYADLK
jgi:N-acetylmuramoyl-L-alanine amidase